MAGISRGECGGSSRCESDALRADAKRHGGGGGWLLKHVREHGRVGNMATPRRSPLWPFVAYGALALVMLAMSDWPIDAKGRPETAPRDRDAARTLR